MRTHQPKGMSPAIIGTGTGAGAAGTIAGAIAGGITAGTIVDYRITYGSFVFAMPLVTGVDGKVYELDEETLAKYLIADEDVEKLGLLPPLPGPPAEPFPVSGAAKQGVVVRQGPVGSMVIDIKPTGT
jgi:hypothetical protein